MEQNNNHIYSKKKKKELVTPRLRCWKRGEKTQKMAMNRKQKHNSELTRLLSFLKNFASNIYLSSYIWLVFDQKKGTCF